MKENPIAIKWLTSPQYILLNEWATSIHNDEKGIELFQKLFPQVYSSKMLMGNSEKYNIQNLFIDIKGRFIRRYGFEPKSELVSKYNGMLNSLYDSEINRFIYVDELLQLSVILFLATMLTWDDNIEDQKMYGNCFRFTLFLLNDVCIFGEVPNATFFMEHLPNLLQKVHIVELAEDCFWTIMAFTIAHELAHEYLLCKSEGKASDLRNIKKSLKEEFAADRIAYDIVLDNIIESDHESFMLKKYTYLSPMMYMDFFDLYYYTDRVLYKKYVPMISHPTPIARKAALFNLVNNDQYVFDTEDGNDLYNCFLNSVDLYKEELLLKNLRGKLKEVTYTQRRDQLEG